VLEIAKQNLQVSVLAFSIQQQKWNVLLLISPEKNTNQICDGARTKRRLARGKNGCRWFAHNQQQRQLCYVLRKLLLSGPSPWHQAAASV
jgi:hypothetical protein